MSKELEQKIKKGKTAKITGAIVAIIGIIVSILGSNVEKEAEKELLKLNQGKLGQTVLK